MLFNSLYLNFENAEWIFNKEKVKDKNLSSIASFVSDEVFSLTPIVHNELIVRDRMSAMSVSGSVSLLKLIFNNSEQKNLGMTGHPSEYGVYLSLIKRNNLHIKNDDGYEFSVKKTKNTSLKIIHDEFLKLIKGSKEAINLSEIYGHFIKQPYGIKLGLLPLLIGLFFKANESSCALYIKMNRENRV